MKIVQEVEHSFKLAGANVTCSDIEDNFNFTRFYLACFRKSTEALPGVIYVSEFNASTGELINTVSTTLNEDFQALHAVKIVLTNITKNGIEERVAVVYDQGLSTTNSSKNFWISVYSGVDSGEQLVHEGFVNLRDAIKGITSFFDTFHYQHGLLVTGFVNSSTTILITSCGLVSGPDPLSLNCGKSVPTMISQGYAGIFNTGQFVMVDLSSTKSNMRICDLNAHVEEQTWDSCRSYLDIDFIEGAFITEVVGNVDVLMAKYDAPDGTYAGHTVFTNAINIDPIVPAEWVNTDTTVHATVLDRRIHYVSAKMAWLH
jgi:hypothetical protein